MNHSLQVRRSDHDRDVSDRRVAVAPARAMYILLVSGTLAIVTFTLVYLATFSYTFGY